MELSCAFPPSLAAVDHIVEAERLGYERAWLFDSPALYPDIWAIAALAAVRTERIGLGPAVLVPNLRHPLTQASAIATLEHLAPGRAVVAIGTGFTGRMAMGKNALTWAYTRRYIEQLRALLRGEAVEVDGAIVQMLHGDGFAPERPIATPIVVAANGPKGMDVAGELGDGVMTIGGGEPSFELVLGARLRNRARRRRGPGLGSRRSRPRARRSPSCTTRCTKAIPASVDGSAGRRRVAGPRSRRSPKLNAIWRCTRIISSRVTDRDRPLLTATCCRAFTWTGAPPSCAPGSSRSQRRAGPRSSTRRWDPTSRASCAAFAEMAGWRDEPSTS